MQFIQNLTQSISNYYIKRYAGSNKTKRSSINYENAEKIGILLHFVNLEDSRSVHEFIHKLHQDKKNVDVLFYKDSNKEIPLKFEHILLKPNQIGNFANLKSEEANKFMKNNFDIIYCITDKMPKAFEIILARSRAKSRLGRHYPKKEILLDFMIDTKGNNNISYLIDQIIHFSKVFKSI